MVLLPPHSLAPHVAAFPVSLLVEAEDLFLTFLQWLLLHASVSPLGNTEDFFASAGTFCLFAARLLGTGAICRRVSPGPHTVVPRRTRLLILNEALDPVQTINSH